MDNGFCPARPAASCSPRIDLRRSEAPRAAGWRSTPLDNGTRFEFFNDLWAFDGKQWSALAPSGSGRSGQRLAYHSPLNRVFSFGGYSGGQSLSDLLRLEDDAWQRVADAPDRPTAEGGFVFDSKRNRFVVFGGSAGRGRVHGDTREFDGTHWRTITGTGPDARQAFAMVYDEKRGRTVVFGGMSADGSRAFDDTWEYDGSAWVRIQASGPAARNAPGCTYDSKRGVFVLFGGAGKDGFLGDTWSWDGVRWQQLASAGPAPRVMGQLAYDKARDRVVLFGGRNGWPNGDLNDTWEWDGKTWTRFLAAGSSANW
jgi:hypothetical protein